uniref:DNA replication complex GINS protein PSF3 n=1 Tax=Ditylenchus dipsaci TaxID=166011 RepID=A0A915D0A9_9BILA
MVKTRRETMRESSQLPTESVETSSMSSASNQQLYSAPISDASTSSKTLWVDESYFDLGAIVAANSNVKCTFDKRTPVEFFPLIGQKKPACIPEKGLQVEVPAWIVHSVNNFCQITIPTAYASVRRDSIRAASSQDANFQSFPRHFYSLGMLVCRLAGRHDAEQIAVALLAAFTQRIEWILRQSLKLTLKTDKMDEWERRVFRKSQAAEKEMSDWTRCVQKQAVKRKHHTSMISSGLLSRLL